MKDQTGHQWNVQGNGEWLQESYSLMFCCVSPIQRRKCCKQEETKRRLPVRNIRFKIERAVNKVMPLRVHGITVTHLQSPVGTQVLKIWSREERRLMHLVPAPAVRLMKRRVLSRPGVNSRQPTKVHHKSIIHESLEATNSLWRHLPVASAHHRL